MGLAGFALQYLAIMGQMTARRELVKVSQSLQGCHSACLTPPRVCRQSSSCSWIHSALAACRDSLIWHVMALWWPSSLEPPCGCLPSGRHPACFDGPSDGQGWGLVGDLKGRWTSRLAKLITRNEHRLASNKENVCGKNI